jgi:TolB-like protein/DNA-binding SARP family transcriptional activator
MDTASASGKGIEGPTRWSLRLFGEFELSALPGGEKVALPGKRERVLLAYLALSPNSRQLRRKLVTLLWGDATDATLLDNLRTCVWNLRKALGDTERRVISSKGRDIVLDAAAFEVDVLAFRGVATQSGSVELEDAAKLFTGEFLDGMGIESEEFESWRREEATRCKDQALDVLTRLMTQLAECGETDRAIEVGARILRLDPLHEAAVRGLMRLYGGSGRRGSAVQLYRKLVEALRRELNAQPEAETQAVYAEIARGGEEQRQAPEAADTKLPPLRSSLAPLTDAPSGQLPPSVQDLIPANGALGQARKLNWILAGGLAAAIALVSYQLLAPTRTVQDEQTRVAEAPVASSTQAAISMAVLPFENLSGDSSQEFFSDGITEEITAALAKISDLRVVARTSAYQFKGQNKDMRAVGQALGATHLLEGSVRKAGDRLRITAQLIKADDGTHIWTENYDRELSDVFAVQEDIAQAIAGALRMPLGLKPGEHLVVNRAIDPESYQQFLRARLLVRGLADGVPQAIEILEPLVLRNPDYAPAWALLGRAYAYLGPLVRGAERRRKMEEFFPKAEAAAHRAIQLDSNLADAYVALSGMARGKGKLLAAEELDLKALAVDSNSPDALAQYMIFLSIVGRRMEALAMAEQLRTLEPYVPAYKWEVGEILWENGQDAPAIEILASSPDQPAARISLAMVYASLGRYKEAADTLAGLKFPPYVPPGPTRTVRAVEGVLRTAPAKADSPQSLPGNLGPLGFVYLHVGALARALEPYEETAESGLLAGAGGDVGFLWHPSYAPVRKLDRFKTYVRNAGLVEYWRVKGWPEFCHPTTGDDFACD